MLSCGPNKPRTQIGDGCQKVSKIGRAERFALQDIIKSKQIMIKCLPVPTKTDIQLKLSDEELQTRTYNGVTSWLANGIRIQERQYVQGPSPSTGITNCLSVPAGFCSGPILKMLVLQQLIVRKSKSRNVGSGFLSECWHSSPRPRLS